jgi:hypothetical protein
VRACRPGGGRRRAALELRAQLVVLLDQPGELALDLVEEGVDLLLVVPRFPIGGFLNATLWTSAGVSGIETPWVEVRSVELRGRCSKC